MLRRAVLIAIGATLLYGGAPAGAQEPPLLVFAAASLKNALDEIGAAWTKQSGTAVRVSYAASPALAKQIEQGAPADLFISADLDWMDYVDQKGLLRPGTRQNLLGNALTMVVLEQGRVIAVGPRDEIVWARGPMSASEQLEPFSVLAGKVLAYDVDNRMTRVAVGGHVLSAPGEIGASGAPIRLRVRARDVSIALTPPSAISIRNILPGVIAGIESGQGAEVEVMIDLGGDLPRLSARITRAACRDLGLATGTRVYALVKAVEVDRSA